MNEKKEREREEEREELWLLVYQKYGSGYNAAPCHPPLLFPPRHSTQKQHESLPWSNQDKCLPLGAGPKFRHSTTSESWHPVSPLINFPCGTRQPCASLMYKMGQELETGRYSCRQGSLQCWAERLFFFCPGPRRALGLLACYILGKGILAFWGFGMCAAQQQASWDLEPKRTIWKAGSKLFSKPSFRDQCLPPLLRVFYSDHTP